MPEHSVVAPDVVESRFTNREENSTRVELQSKFVSKEVYKLSENLYQDETTEKPYMPEEAVTQAGGIVLNKRTN